MKRQSMATNDSGQNGVTKALSHAFKFKKVVDGRKAPIRGLWVRNGRYYARLAIENTTGQKRVRRVPLVNEDTKKPVQTVPQAVAAMNRLKVNRSDNNLPVLGLTPKFSDFVTTYLDYIKAGAVEVGGRGRKKQSTIKKEEYCLNRWKTKLGDIRMDKINPDMIDGFTTQRLKAGVSPRTVNLDVGTLRNILKLALRQKWIKVLPTANTPRLTTVTKKRELFTVEDLEALCAAAKKVTKNASQFCDYLRFLAYSGAREQEALAVQWRDVNFDRELLTIGAMGDTKNNTGRVVNFNCKLKAHLLDMKKRNRNVSDWLFPSPQRGKKDIHAHTFRESLKLARTHAAKKHPHLATKAFHDMRHHFISYAVMSGIDYMTIAEWVGHRDGGVLIGKVYGHLADEHKKEQAQKLNFGPVVLEAVV